MGYNTKFVGEFILDRELENETFNLLYNLAKTRRVSRNISVLVRIDNISEQDAKEKYGTEGEFYFSEKPSHIAENGVYKRVKDETVLDNNLPPATQPSLWCGWIPTEDKRKIIWDGNEKFNQSVEWIEYIIHRILSPKDYEINGQMNCYGEVSTDSWKIVIKNNKVI